MAGGRLSRQRARLGAGALIAIAVASCGKVPHESRPAWRDEAERACLRSGAVRESAYIERAPAIDGPGACGALQPFHISALADGKVGLTLPASLAGRGHKAYAATLTCEMVPALESFMAEKVQTSAAAVYGQAVVEMHTLGSYSCRRMNNGSGTSMISEHAFADAIDVSGFTLADGREVMVRSSWRGAPEDQEFLRSVFVGSCEIFHTVLGPGSDGHHEDHFHLDLMRHASGHHICRPVIKFTPRTAAPLDTPVQPPVAPGQMQQEPEADDPYAFDDAAPAQRAVVSREPEEPAPQYPAPQRSAARAQPTYASAAPLAARPNSLARGDEVEVSPLPISSKGDRLDRVGAAQRASLPAAGVTYKDATRLGAGEPPAPPSRPAYAAAQPPRPPGFVPMPTRGAPMQAAPARPLSPAATPPGWTVGPQPVARSAPAGRGGGPRGGEDDAGE
jgi:hypothetical protein